MPSNRSREGSPSPEPTMERAPLNPWWMVEELIFPGNSPAESQTPPRRSADGLERTTRELPPIDEPEAPPGPARRP